MLRLLWLFARSIAVAGIIASAVYAALYVARDMRASNDAPAATANSINLPNGFELLTPLTSTQEFRRTVGFAPVVPKSLPSGTASPVRLDATQPDATGARTGELRFAAERDASGAALGPSLLLSESKDTGAAVDATVRTVAAGTLAAAIRCGRVRIDALVYAPSGADPARATATAQRFIDALAAQCSR